MKNIFKLLMATSMSFLVVGCGSEVSVESDITVVATKSTLKANNKSLEMNLLLSNNYASDVQVEVKDLALNVSPCVVRNSSLTPNHISFEDERNVNVLAKLSFKESCVPTAYRVEGITLLTLDGKSRELSLSSSWKDLNTTQFTSVGGISDTNDTNGSGEILPPDTFNYAIDFSLDKESPMKFALNEKRSFTLRVIDKDTKSPISSSDIIKIEVKSKQPNILKIFDADKYDTPSEKLIYEKENEILIYMQTYTRSGLADIDVKVDYLNSKGKPEHIEKTYATLVMSGAPTAFSINSAGVSYNSETKWFEHKYMISAVDRYNNIVNISPTIYVSAISGLARDSSGKEILYGKFGDVKGTLNPEDGTFKATKAIFDNLDLNRDSLFIFGDVKQYEALGKWDIDPYSDSSDTLKLAEVFNGTTKSGLGFLVGHNYLDDISSSSSKEWQVKIDSSDGTYQLDEEGKAFVMLKYPPYFIGKRVAFAINFLGKTPESNAILRSGEVEIMTARNLEGIKTPEAISVDANSTLPKVVRIPFEIDTGTEDSFFVRNSHVGCNVEAKNVVWKILSENKISATVEEYIANGSSDVAHWIVEVSSTSATEDGTLTFKECNVVSLPSF